MSVLRNGAVAALIVTLIGLQAGPAGAQQRTVRDGNHGDDVQKPDPERAVHEGETIAPQFLGPGRIEQWDAAVARQREHDLQPDVIKGGAPFNRSGEWAVPSRRSTYIPKSGDHYITNKWGDLRMAVAFPQTITMQHVWVLGQGGAGVWPEAIRAIGYRNGAKVDQTEWFEAIQAEPTKFEINLENIDRIVFEARQTFAGGAWYGLDDFTYSRADDDEPAGRETIVLNFDDLNFRTMLTNRDYGGLTWETGAGEIPQGDAVHPPVAPPGAEEKEAGVEDAGPQADRGTATLPDLALGQGGIIRGDAGQFSYPPDTCGAVGGTHVMVAVNRTVGVYSKGSGAEQSVVSLTSFQNASGGDPRVAYDPHHNRWIVISTDFDDTIFVAYSLSDNALGGWYKTSFIASQGIDSSRWPDYPTLGVDANGIYTSAYMVGGGHTLFAIDKAPLLDASPSLGTVTAFRGLPYEGAIQPAITWGDSGGEYVISRASSTQLRLRQVVGPMTSPTLQERGFVSVPGHGNPPDAPARDSGTDMDTVGSRLMNAQWINGYLWTANTTNWGGRAAVRWYRINTTSLFDESGLISDSSLSYYFPSIAANVDGDAAIGFSGSSPGHYIGAYYTGREAEDPSGATAPPVLMREGGGSQNNIDGYGRNRWGDYSLTVLDPTDERTLWTIQSYAHATNIWGTYFARLEFEDIVRPVNNDCAAGIVTVTEGEPLAFSTVNANTDGFDEPGCGFAGGNEIDNDIWFQYTPTCAGAVTIQVCDTDFNARAAVYFVQCPQSEGAAIACSTANCGVDGDLTVDVSAGFTYWIRVGGANGETGTGTLTVECPTADCPADLVAPAGAVDVFDMLELLAGWGTNGVGADLAMPIDTVDVFDLLELLSAWGPC